ncbi:hypothetical protein CP556_21440 [Natrinema sp. CBA1119]|uniref:hypothetical protein n=1 Tax=Natrinema sp. CBA1119 TaxID=1608465 RepID=UPI000BF9EA57|nr:hypothetical protein [Natrinema sp. CBA1119]PGF14426.1 hypothetical protein CP556_21440 [Natrinema sp. CBA1119]
MSIEADSTTTHATPRRADPFAGLREDQVLRCGDPTTGWQWFYDCDGSTVLKYHERDGYVPTPTALTEVAETVALESTEAYSVSEVYLEVYAGERV